MRSWIIKREVRNEPTMPFGKFRDVKKVIVGYGEGSCEDPFHVVHETFDSGEIREEEHLISAAPDLLSACEELLAEVANGKVGLLNVHPDHQVPSLAMVWIKEAIAKAKGGDL